MTTAFPLKAPLDPDSITPDLCIEAAKHMGFTIARSAWFVDLRKKTCCPTGALGLAAGMPFATEYGFTSAAAAVTGLPIGFLAGIVGGFDRGNGSEPAAGIDPKENRLYIKGYAIGQAVAQKLAEATR